MSDHPATDERTRIGGTTCASVLGASVSYKSGNDTGLALYGHDKDGWTGLWTYAGGKELGTEKWTAE